MCQTQTPHPITFSQYSKQLTTVLSSIFSNFFFKMFLCAGIATLLYYLELHNSSWLENLSPVYSTCTVKSYSGAAALHQAASKVGHSQSIEGRAMLKHALFSVHASYQICTTSCDQYLLEVNGFWEDE